MSLSSFAVLAGRLAGTARRDASAACQDSGKIEDLFGSYRIAADQTYVKQ
jgi:hypothetical protein